MNAVLAQKDCHVETLSECSVNTEGLSCGDIE